MTYTIRKDILKTNNYSSTSLKPEGMVVHCTASQNATAKAIINYFNTHGEKQTSVHGCIDWTEIVQTAEYNKRCWHCGGTGNSKFIGIELCEPKAGDKVKFNEVWKRAIWYYAYIFVNVLKIKKVTKDNLMSHEEVSLKWHESTHVDPKAYFKMYGKTIDDFRKDVQAEIDKMIAPPIKKPSPTPTNPPSHSTSGGKNMPIQN